MSPSKELSFYDHLDELRRVLIKSFVFFVFFLMLALFHYEKICTYLTQSFYQNSDQHLYLLSPLEGIFTIFKVAFLSSFCLSLPFICFQVFSFVSPALGSSIQKSLPFYLFISILLFFSGLYVGQHYMLPLASEYLANLNAPFGENMWTLSSYLNLVFMMSFGFAAFLEMLFITFALINLGNIPANQLRKFRKSFIIISFVLGAVFTPPDVISQILFATPLILVYEICYWYSLLKKKN